MVAKNVAGCDVKISEMSSGVFTTGQEKVTRADITPIYHSVCLSLFVSY